MDAWNAAASIGDGCTLWFDRLGDLDWRQCCDAHDLAYYQQADKWEADVQLALCVADAGAPIIGIIMFVGVSLFGWIWYRRRQSLR